MPANNAFNPTGWLEFTPDNNYIACTMAVLAYNSAAHLDGAITGLMGGVIHRDAPLGVLVDDLSCVRWVHPQMDLFGIEGTTTQWGRYLFQPGTPNRSWLPQGTFVQPYFLEHVDNVLQYFAGQSNSGKPMVLIGHSLGGVVASLVAFRLRQLGWNIQGTYTYGSPKAGNAALSNAYTARNYRVHAPNDPVAALPPDGLRFTDQVFVGSVAGGPFHHVGLPILVGNLDYDELREDTAASMKQFGLQTIFRLFRQHLLGVYLESVWNTLSLSSKRKFIGLFNILRNAGYHGVPAETLTAGYEAATQQRSRSATTAEQAFGLGMIGPNGKMKIRLYQGPAGNNPPSGLIDFTEADYPGYEPLTPPADMRLYDVGGKFTESSTGLVEFIVPESLEKTATVWGIYVTAPGSNGELKTLAYSAFSAPKHLQAKGDRVKVGMTFKVAKIAD